MFEQVGKSGNPVLLIWGRADGDVPFAVSDDVRRAIPQAEFHPIGDAAHVPFYEHPEIANRYRLNFCGANQGQPVGAAENSRFNDSPCDCPISHYAAS